jgi:hypothetical protein
LRNRIETFGDGTGCKRDASTRGKSGEFFHGPFQFNAGDPC